MQVLLFMIWVSTLFNIIACCAYGDGCRYPCRCRTGKCDSITGDCKQGCALSPPLNTGLELGWKGSGCRIGNIAYQKSTDQSGAYEDYTSELAVDGNFNTTLPDGSCAHPSTGISNGPPAWWMVNRGKKHVIQEIIIFNRERLGYRTNEFYIRIGMTSTISEQDLCIYYNDGEQDVLTLRCTTDFNKGQYVSMERQEGSDEHHLINICEFVIIGYKPIECTNCKGKCDDLTGCDICTAGFKLPNCVDECHAGTWGSNCAQVCGKCANNQKCDTDNGICSDGCALWYLNNKCDTFISRPSLEQSDVFVNVFSSFTMVVTWQQYQMVSNGLDGHYIYRVHYGSPGEDKMLSAHVQHNSSSDLIYLELTDLEFNTEYEVEVVPYHVQGEVEEAGVSSGAVVNKTNCVVPSKPYLNVTKDADKWTLYFTALRNIKSGCDVISSYTLNVAHENTVYHMVSVWNLSSLVLPLKPVYIEAEVWVTVVNNEQINRQSRKEVLRMGSSTVAAIPTYEADMDGTPQNNTALIIGCVVGVLGGLALVGALALTLRRSKHCSTTNNNVEMTQTQTELALHMKTPDFSETCAVYENTITDEESGISNRNPECTTAEHGLNQYESLETREVNNEQVVYHTLE